MNDKIYKASDLFSPSLELWSYVISQQDTGKAILNFGKRDVSYDLGFPTPLAIYRNSKLIKKINQNDKIKIFKLMDQHAYIKYNYNFNLRVGDLLKFGVSHPFIIVNMLSIHIILLCFLVLLSESLFYFF